MAVLFRCHHHHHLPFLPIAAIIFLVSPCFSQHHSSSVLLIFKSSLTKSDSLYNWKDDGSDPCDPNNTWIGIICTNGNVTTINLSGLDLEGQPNMGVLEHIEHLKAVSIENNSLSGPMPEINRLRHIKAFYGGNNWFSGGIPSDFFQTLASLKKLWLQHNNFTGQIPRSIGELPNLKELHLEYNDFSGPIPAFPDADIIITLDLSNNKLQGEIPNNLDKFDKKVFENNADLCGSKLKKPCNTPSTEKNSWVPWIIMFAVVALIILIIFARVFQVDQYDNNRPLGKQGYVNEAVVNIPKTTSSAPVGAGMPVIARGNNLVMVNEERGVFGLQDLMKAAAEVLGNGGLGSAYKAMLGNGVTVVVKRVKEMNQMNKNTFDAEMKKFARLKHKNILAPLAYHFRNDEKLLVSEYVAKGSLLCVLHGDRGISHAELDWRNRLKIIKGIARGMAFLFKEFESYQLPHGNLKSSNVLIGSDYEPLLSDYAFHPLLNNTPTVQCMFAYKSPEAILNQTVTKKSDVYCLGIVILETITGKYPSLYVSNEKGGTDVVQLVRSALAENRQKELIDPVLASSSSSVSEMEKLLHIGVACTESEPDKRIDLDEAIKRINDVSV